MNSNKIFTQETKMGGVGNKYPLYQFTSCFVLGQLLRTNKRNDAVLVFITKSS